MKKARLAVWSIIAAALVLILVLSLTGYISIPRIYSIFGSSVYYPDSKLYTVGGGSVSIRDISSVEIDWIAGDVEIAVYEGREIKFSESSLFDMRPNEEMRYLVKNGKLTIRFCAPGRLFERPKSLTVYIPEDYKPDKIAVDTASASVDALDLKALEIKLETVSGSITASGIESGSLSLETVSGKITGVECTAETLKTDSVSGSINCEGNFIRVDSESVSGGITIAPGEDVLRIRAETVSGGVRIELPENIGFTAGYSSVSGDFSCDFQVVTDKKTVTHGNGETQINLETVSGNIKISKT